MSCKPSLSVPAEAELQESRKTYDEMDVHIRNMLWLRARDVKGRAFASTALAVRDTFVQVCLMGRRTDAEVGLPNMQQSAQVQLIHPCLCLHVACAPSCSHLDKPMQLAYG